MTFTASEREDPDLALGLILASLRPQSPVPGVTAFWGCHLMQAQLSPWTKGRGLWIPWIQRQQLKRGPGGARGSSSNACPSARVSTSQSLPGEANREGVFLKPKKKLLKTHPSHLQFQRRKLGTWGGGETY